MDTQNETIPICKWSNYTGRVDSKAKKLFENGSRGSLLCFILCSACWRHCDLTVCECVQVCWITIYLGSRVEFYNLHIECNRVGYCNWIMFGILF